MLEDIDDNHNLITLGYEPHNANKFSPKHLRSLVKALLTGKFKTSMSKVYHLEDDLF